MVIPHAILYRVSGWYTMTEEIVSVDGEKSRSEIASTLRTIADQFDGGDRIDLEIEEQSASLALADDLEFELEIDREPEDGNEIELEIEIEWSEPTGETDDSGGEDSTESTPVESGDDAESVADGHADHPSEIESLGEFQLFSDHADEWRWRLVHRNGNIIATSGEGYTTKRNANKGIRSVLQNAPGAEVIEIDGSS